MMQGFIEEEGEFRWYAFVLDQKSKVTLYMELTDQLDADLAMFWLNPDTYTLEMIGGSAEHGMGISEFYYDILDAGTYYFAVAGDVGIGEYAFAYYKSTIDVQYEINDSIGSASNIALNADIVGVLDSPFDIDYYCLTVTEPIGLRFGIESEDNYTLTYLGYLENCRYGC